MPRLHPCLVPLVGLALCLPASPRSARADDGPSDEELGQAREVFAEALELAEQERWGEAEERFRLVLQVRSSPVVSYNLGSALMHQGRMVEAGEVLRGVVRDEAADEQSREAAQQLLATVEPQIGSLTVRLAGDTEGAVLSIDGRPVEISGLVQAISVDPGSHELVLERRGALVSSRRVEVGGEGPLHVEVRLELPATADLRVAERAAALDTKRGLELEPERRPQGAPVDDDDGVLSRWWFWVGAGAVIAGGVMTAMVLADGGGADPIAGDTDPPLIRGRVAP